MALTMKCNRAPLARRAGIASAPRVSRVSRSRCVAVEAVKKSVSDLTADQLSGKAVLVR